MPDTAALARLAIHPKYYAFSVCRLKVRYSCFFCLNAKLTHGSLEPAGGSKKGQGEGAEAAEAASVTEPVKL